MKRLLECFSRHFSIGVSDGAGAIVTGAPQLPHEESSGARLGSRTGRSGPWRTEEKPSVGAGSAAPTPDRDRQGAGQADAYGAVADAVTVDADSPEPAAAASTSWMSGEASSSNRLTGQTITAALPITSSTPIVPL